MLIAALPTPQQKLEQDLQAIRAAMKREAEEQGIGDIAFAD